MMQLVTDYGVDALVALGAFSFCAKLTRLRRADFPRSKGEGTPGLRCRLFGCVVQCWHVSHLSKEHRCYGSGECCRCRAPLVPRAKVLKR